MKKNKNRGVFITLHEDLAKELQSNASDMGLPLASYLRMLIYKELKKHLA